MTDVTVIDQQDKMPALGGGGSLAPMQLIQMAVQNGGAIEQLEKLMELQERWEKKEARKSYFEALANFQASVPVIVKMKEVFFEGKNGGAPTNYKYAPLDDIMEQIKQILCDNGLTVRWEQSQGEGGIIEVTCIVTHKMGHSERVRLSALPDTTGSKSGPKSIASTVTYLKRYTVLGALGIATADEDMLDRLPPSDSRVADEVSNFKFYPDDKFIANFKTWEKNIKAGKISVDGVINKVQSKFTFTDDQIKQLESLK